MNYQAKNRRQRLLWVPTMEQITKADKPLCFSIRGRVGNAKPEKEMGGAVCSLVPPL